MENIRKRFMGDSNLYPEFRPSRQQMESPPISIASTSSTSSASSSTASNGPAHRAQAALKRSTIIISSDEEDELDDSDGSNAVEVVTKAEHKKPPPQEKLPQLNMRQPVVPPQQVQGTSRPKQPTQPAGARIPIRIPSNQPLQRPPSEQALQDGLGDGEVIKLPDFQHDNTLMSAADAEKALRELMTGGMNQELDSTIEIDMSQEAVDGFNEGIKLLPHQILGRAWMKDREDLTKKRSGGILADDMGLGKTIQTLTRIVEGKAKRSDKEDGWSASTLVICPLALIEQWASEISKMTGLRAVKHHGPDRTTDPGVLQRYHVVITTYDTVKSEYSAFNPAAKDESKSSSKKKANKEFNDDSDSSKAVKRASKTPTKCALYGVKWFRIVLDEAHNIKNVKTRGAIACCELQGKFRWCLTGTPMQNNVTELFSLFKFLRIKPLSNWDTFNEQIAKPVNRGRGAGRAMKRLQVVLKQVMLRRKKDQLLNGEVLIKLPKRQIEIVSCEFDSSEQEFYSTLETKMEEVIEKLMSSEKGNKYIGVLTSLLRLRQACNHPILVSKDYKRDAEAIEPKAVPKGKEDNDPDQDDLIAAFGQMGIIRKCQMCTIDLTPDNAGEGEWGTCKTCVPLAIRAKEAERERPSSAKVRMILKLLRQIDERSNSEDKTIVFSQFTSMLDLLEPFLQDEGIKYVRYDGSMPQKDREASLNKIRTSRSTRVILISFKAGSTGLNLTACNNVILVDLWWNPALEDQAFDRAHRFGQTKDVNIFKLKIDHTVEDRILLLQEKKRALAAAALSGDKTKDMRLGMDDLLALFRPGGRDDDDEEDFD